MQWSDSIKKRACRYLLQRYVGQFLEEKLTLDKLSVNICSGTGSVSNVSLDAQALNEHGAQKNFPVEFVDGFIKEIAVSIPWATLLTDSIYVEVTGMHITIQPKQRPDDAGSMLESMWSSMASSIQLAAECLKQDSNSTDEKEPESENMMEGLEIFAHAIESILTRVKVKFIDTCIRLEHLPKEGKNGIAVEIKLKSVEYCDETSCEWGAGASSCPENAQKSPSSFSIKKFHCDGITFYTDEFPVENRTFSRSIIIEDEKINKSSDKIKVTSEPILIGMLSGSGVVRVKLKLDPTSHDPKVDLEFTLGSFTFFLSPRQLYLLVEIVQSLVSPHNQDTSNVISVKAVTQKVMSSHDFKKVEQDLQETLNFPAYHYPVVKGNHGKGWSSASFDEGDEEFHPMKLTNLMSGSVTSNATDTSFGSHASTYTSKPEGSHLSYDFPSLTNTPFKKKLDRGSLYDSDVVEETSAFHLQLSSIAAVILHEDILTFGLDSCELTPSSVSTMKNLSTQFFTQLGKFVLAGNKDFEAFKQALSNTCSLNHIRLLGTTIIVEANDAGNSSHSSFSSVVSAANLEILECLVENISTSDGKPQFVELLNFMKTSNCDRSIRPHFPISNQPDVRVHIHYTKRNHHSRRSSRLEMLINLEQCWSEVDLSILDRISTVINTQSLCHIKSTPKDLDQQSSFTQALESGALCDKSFYLKVQSPFLVIKFRFPIPDLRPDHEKGKFPWWQRSIRKDILYANLVETTFHTDQSTKIPMQEYHLASKEVTFLFKEGNTDCAIPFLHSSGLFSNTQENTTAEPCPRLKIRLLPLQPLTDEEVVHEKEDNLGLSCSTIMCNTDKEPSPFMSKKVVHESDTHHHSVSKGEELLIPGLAKDMNKFITHACEDAKIHIDITLPYLCIEFPSKHLYEIIYNRITSDLTLLQFTAPKHRKDLSGIDPTFCNSSFSMCKSGLQFDSDSDESDDLNFKSAHRSDFSQYSIQYPQSNFALNINVTKGVLDVCQILKDSSSSLTPDKYGEIYFDVSEGSVFVVTHYRGKPQQNYICLQVKGMQVYHKAEMEGNMSAKRKKLHNLKSPPSHLDPILIKSNREVIVTSLNPEGCNSNMFVAAISTQINERRMKTTRIACSINKATLRHHVTLPRHSWLTQFIDFFDVVDYPVKGYDSPQVVTELYLHLWDCAIDYRPLYLPMCCVITLGNLSISSNITARTKTSTLRFIAEETSLFISNKVKNNNSPPNLKEEYISVIQLGLFELSLRISDQANNSKIDLKASNNVLNIRTCSDSASALANLIIYYALEGDLKKKERKNKDKKSTLSKDKSEEKSTNCLSESAAERVNDMMEDAMKELCGQSNVYKDDINEKLVDVFYFPGEGASQNSQPIDYGDYDDFDHDFCILENEFGVGLMNMDNGRPEIRYLSDKKIQIKENHFNVGTGTSDQLLSPKCYPTPVYRYTLSDMNIVWHMYGGRDFAEKESSKKNVKFSREPSHTSDPAELEITGLMEDRGNIPDVFYTQDTLVIGNTMGPKHGNNKKQQANNILNWQLNGGAGRQHNVLMEFHFNKVKFQHEIYPENAQQASRQVLLIHEFEIRDKLSSSQINKFLYQYSSESNPRQSHANMVSIKALHLRPDSRRNIQETCLKVSLLPLRLNIDQDSMEFLVTFFTELSDLTSTCDEEGVSKHPHSFPVMVIDGETIHPLNKDSADPSDLNNGQNNANSDMGTANGQGGSPTFIRSFLFSPEVPIRIDYVGKHVDLTHGPLAGLFMGLGQLSCLQIKLKRINYKHGLLGFDRLLSFAISEWLKDIKKTQFPCIIGGVGPMHALVQLFQGIRDLFWLPIEQYQKDGRIVRGLQRGANSFTTSTAIAALELTARIVQAIQSIAEAAFDMVSPGPSVRGLNGTNKHKKQHLFSHPADIREGVSNAITLVKEGLGETAETLVRVASAEAEQKGAVGAVGGVLRQIPPTVVAPIILASAATSNLLDGVRSQLAPDTQREATNKWKQNISDK